MKLKIGRHTYNITESDVFMDNGSCVQLLSQRYGRRFFPVLSKKAIKKIARFKRIEIPHRYGIGVQVFKLDISILNGFCEYRDDIYVI